LTQQLTLGDILSELKIFKYFLSHFVRDEEGVVAVIFAVLLLPIIAFSGAAIDYSQATSVKNQIQVATDAAALAAGSASLETSDIELLEEVAKKVFNQSMINSGFAGIIDIEVTQITDGVQVSANTTVPTGFLKLIGLDYLDISSFSEIVVSATQIEIALVLDNTFSMDGSKLKALKKSSELLVNSVMPKDESDNVKLALVPFTQVVNIGKENKNEPGIDVPNNITIPQPPACRNTYPNSTRKCDRKKVTYQCVTDGVASTCTRWKYYNCTGSRGDPVWKCTPRSPYKFRWFGNMGSRDYPLNTKDISYDTDKVPGLLTRWNLYWALRPITRLTNKKDVVLKAIGDMRTTRSSHSYTYIPAGLIWGWRLLSNKAPFTDAKPYSDVNTKVMVILTDGANTRSTGIRNSTQNYTWMLNQGALPSNKKSWHYGDDIDEANNLTQKLCKNIKKENIIVYTIAFDVTDSKIKKILQKCAGNGGEYFDASSESELEAAFKSISKELLDLRLTK